MMYNGFVEIFYHKERRKNNMKKTRLLAVLAAGAIMLSGCGGNKDLKKVAMKIDGVKVTAGDIAVMTDLMIGQSGSTEINFEELKNENAKQIEEVLKYAALGKAMGIELTEEELNSARAVRASFAKSNGGYKAFEKYLKENGSSIETIDKIFISSIYVQKVEEKVTEELAKKEPTDKELEKYYNDNYYCAKHILVNKPVEGAEVVEGEKQGEELANELLERAKGGEDFNAMITTYSQDPGASSYPDGYVFTDGDMLPPFESKVKELKPGEFGICESDYGYHVILRLELPAFADQKATVSSGYSTIRMEKRIEELIKEHKIKIKVDQNEINSITSGMLKKDNKEQAQTGSLDELQMSY